MSNVQNLKIDQQASFGGRLVFLACEPKREMGKQEQARTNDGRGKWEIQVLAATRDQFGKSVQQVLKVGMTSSTNPAEGLSPFSIVQLGDLEFGVMEKTKKNDDGSERMVGVHVWFRCTEIVKIGSVAEMAA